MNVSRNPISVAVTAAFMLTVAGTATAGAQVYRALGGDRVEITTFDGKPPYNRRIVKLQDLSAAERARFEAKYADRPIDRTRLGEKVRVVDRSGKPPFSQRIVTVSEESAAEFARFEESQPDSAIDGAKIGAKVRIIDRTGKPPFSQRVITVSRENAADVEPVDPPRAPK
jgi:hypothetical protein